MRLVALLSVAFIVSSAGHSSAQEWFEYLNRDDYFTVHLPKQPAVENITYTSAFNGELPARLYTTEDWAGRYTVTVVDYTNIEKIAAERVKGCPPGNEPCRGGPQIGWGYWRIELRGALVWASWKYLQRDAKLTYYIWNNVDMVEGHELTLVNNADQSTTYLSIYLHESRLYILDATVPRGAPAPGLFHSTLRFLDADGTPVRYQAFYAQGYPAPARTQGQGQQGQTQQSR